MTTSVPARSAGQVFSDFLSPEKGIMNSETMRKFYRNYPTLARIVNSVGLAILAVIKVFAFTLMTVLGALVLAAVGVYKCCKGNSSDGKEYLKAAGISLLTFTAVLAYSMISAYYIPINCQFIILGVLTGVSIVVHVVRGVKGPAPVVPREEIRGDDEVISPRDRRTSDRLLLQRTTVVVDQLVVNTAT